MMGSSAATQGRGERPLTKNTPQAAGGGGTRCSQANSTL